MFARSISLSAGQLPEQSASFTNCIFAHDKDCAALGVSPKLKCHVEVRGLVFELRADSRMLPGTVGLNKFMREAARIGLQDNVELKAAGSEGQELAYVKFEVDCVVKPAARLELEALDLDKAFRTRFAGQHVNVGCPIALDFKSTVLKLTPISCTIPVVGVGQSPSVQQGLAIEQTEFDFSQGSSGTTTVLSDKAQTQNIFTPDFNFEDLGIGGLTVEFADIFRRAFASRIFPPSVVRGLGINHVRGMLLYGPPGTGKTLIARKIAKFLKAAEPKIVNGPEILNKYVGQSEENIRNLFADAEKEQKKEGDSSQLHIIIFDEIDAICKQRGRGNSDTGVGDSVVNQLLSKIDGVDSLNNILLIGMTNRLDMIDEALLRPGRLEVHIEISLPDEKGRVEILNIHTASMRKAGYLGDDVDIPALAKETKNMSGAEIEGLIRSATSHAFNRKVDVYNLAKPKDLKEIKVTREDFDHALKEVQPAFGQHAEDFATAIRRGIVPFSQEFVDLEETCLTLCRQTIESDDTPLLSMLLEGPPGAGKTALAAHVARKAGFPFVRIISPENYVGCTEHSKVNAIAKIFDDAYKSTLSCVIVDDVERLIDYVRIGMRFSNVIFQALMVLLKKAPPKIDRRLLVIATTSSRGFLEDAEMLPVFNVCLSVPLVRSSEAFETVLQSLDEFCPAAIPQVVQAIGCELGIKQVLFVAEMAKQKCKPAKVSAEAFMQCMHSCGFSAAFDLH
mmetsp:Transcript_15155/g.33463  ORF Transcript_15155/g.33463 Transcript_15155/m.33463 type:complete len:734 (+) Transcript_15155:24-2225(+)